MTTSSLSFPGYPDNIARGSDGLIWVTIASPPNSLASRIRVGPDVAAPHRRADPDRAPARPARCAWVQAYDDSGRLVHDLRLPHDQYAFVTGVREHDGRVWLGSLHEPAIAVVSL